MTSFAFNYHDGTVSSITTVNGGDSKHTKRVKPPRKKFAIPQIPSLFEFLGFVYCFTTFLAGPAVEYKEYSDTICQTRFVDKNGVRWNVSSVRAAVSKLLQGLGLLLVARHVLRFGSVARILPGVYLFFLTVPLATSVTRLAQRHVRPYLVSSAIKPLYDLASMSCTAMVANYLAVSFVVLSTNDIACCRLQLLVFLWPGLVICYLLLTFVPIKKSTNGRKTL
ncbi:unnamed protein product [Peronospora destructor]|uniref:Uncharacterized protein n=1 Tax=Peronospora destructor TaxID=86335 RepID=A0AAV0UDA7_9STRA|nr:unnamed protein product [Peronospora destructor]